MKKATVITSEISRPLPKPAPAHTKAFKSIKTKTISDFSIILFTLQLFN